MARLIRPDGFGCVVEISSAAGLEPLFDLLPNLLAFASDGVSLYLTAPARRKTLPELPPAVPAAAASGASKLPEDLRALWSKRRRNSGPAAADEERVCVLPVIATEEPALVLGGPGSVF